MKRIIISIASVAIIAGGTTAAGNSHAEKHRDAGKHKATSVHENDEKHAHEADHDEHEEGIVEISPEVAQQFGIRTGTAGSGEIITETTLPGEVTLNMDRLAHVTPRYEGIALEVRKNIGDPVKKGDIMAILEGNDSLTPYPLKAMISGVVIDKHITLGENIRSDQSAFTIADLSNVWVDITLYQKDLQMVRRGQKVSVSGGIHLPTAAGVISYVSPTLDEHTRTGYARLVLPNPGGIWKPGMFITATINTGGSTVKVAVPKTAICVLEHGPAVFVKTDHGFEAREVKTGRENRTTVEITDGLNPGETYVTEGGFTLKAELGRGEMSSGHSH